MRKLFTNSPTPELEVWTKDDKESILAKKFGLALVSQNFVNPATEDAPEEYVFCRKAPGVTVVPVLPNGNIVITRTFKHGTNQIVWEFPAGRKPKDISSSDQARAEMSEESGLITEQIIYLGRACVAPRKFDTNEDLFVALNCVINEPKPGAGEVLEVYELTPEELWKLIRQGDGSFSGFSEMAAQRAADQGYITR